MADEKVTALGELTAVAKDDWLYIVDKSDTTDDAAGSSKKIAISNLGIDEIATFYDAALTQTFSTTESTVTFDSTSLNTATSNFTIASGVITVAEAGNYKLSYNVKCNMNSGTRDNVEFFLQRDPGGLGSFSTIAGTETGLYNRITNTEPTSASCPPFALALTASDDIRLRADATGQTWDCEAAMLTIERIW